MWSGEKAARTASSPESGASLEITIPHVVVDDFVVLAHPLDEKLFYQFPDT
jgi:hypothetical protein